LTVLAPTTLCRSPASRTNVSGTPASFSVTASGTPVPTYQWQHEGTNVPGATATLLSLASVQPPDGGAYTVIVTNNAGSATSSPPALLTVWVSPAITGQPSSRTNVSGTLASFTV